MSDTVDVDPETGLQVWPGFYATGNLPADNSIEHAFGVGWPELDELLRLYAGQFIMVTGKANHGKSAFLYNCLVQLARTKSIAHFMYVPEGEANIKTRLRRIWNDDSTADRFLTTYSWTQSSKPEHYTDEAKTIHWVLDRATWAVQTRKVEVILIDPWNELDHARPRDMLVTEYVRECLMYLKQFCRAMNAIVILVAHPTKAANERSVSLSDIEGSIQWNNKCDNGLVVEREYDKNRCRVASLKVRESPEAGRVGECYFQVDPKTGIFTPEYGSCTL